MAAEQTTMSEEYTETEEEHEVTPGAVYEYEHFIERSITLKEKAKIKLEHIKANLDIEEQIVLPHPKRPNERIPFAEWMEVVETELMDHGYYKLATNELLTALRSIPGWCELVSSQVRQLTLYMIDAFDMIDAAKNAAVDNLKSQRTKYEIELKESNDTGSEWKTKAQRLHAALNEAKEQYASMKEVALAKGIILTEEEINKETDKKSEKPEETEEEVEE